MATHVLYLQLPLIKPYVRFSRIRLSDHLLPAAFVWLNYCVTQCPQRWDGSLFSIKTQLECRPPLVHGWHCNESSGRLPRASLVHDGAVVNSHHRIPYGHLHSNWRAWGQSHHWNHQPWYKARAGPADPAGLYGIRTGEPIQADLPCSPLCIRMMPSSCVT